MSIFSGKCDFYDSFVDIGADGDEKKIEENLKKLKLYVIGKDERDHRVKSDTIQDIAKYYPYLRAFEYGDKEGNRIMILASDSFIDQEERQHRQWMIDDVFKYQRKCKRNKQPFTTEGFFEKYSWRTKTKALTEIVNRIIDKGNKAEFDDIHMPMWEGYRKRWYEELVRLGYTEREAYDWCFKGMFDNKETMNKRLGIGD